MSLQNLVGGTLCPARQIALFRGLTWLDVSRFMQTTPKIVFQPIPSLYNLVLFRGVYAADTPPFPPGEACTIVVLCPIAVSE